MLGGLMDGMCQVLTCSNHLVDGHFLEASWDNSAYTRQWNTHRVRGAPGLGLRRRAVARRGGGGSSAAAIACAYGRATARDAQGVPDQLQVPVSFEPKPYVPPIPRRRPTVSTTCPEVYMSPQIQQLPPQRRQRDRRRREGRPPPVGAPRHPGVTGPKYGCGINVCKACTSHINGKAFNPCSVPIEDVKEKDRRGDHHRGPRRHRPGRPAPDAGGLAAAATSPSAGTASPARSWRRSIWSTGCAREKRAITDNDLDRIRNVCRCGTYVRIREAIEQGARKM